MDWQPWETAPKDGSKILVWATTMDVYRKEYNGPHVTDWWDHRQEWWRRESWYNPTHWAPIEAPKDLIKED